MGRDKTAILLDGVSIAARAARALCAAAYPVLAVGPEAGTALEVVDDPREGPLVAFACGAEALAARSPGARAPREDALADEAPAARGILLLAADMPFVDPVLLRLLVARARDAVVCDAVVPMLGGREQSLCAWYAPRVGARARTLITRGARSMRALLAQLDIVRIPEDEWRALASPNALLDIDTPDDLRRLAPDPGSRTR